MDAVLFLSVVIIALTQMVKMAVPDRITGFVTILIALVIGVLVAVFDNALGIVDVSIAQGIVAALGAVGITTAASKAGTGARGDV